ncbi:type I-E CRISPR-associated protein Cas5/CasD [Amycolatopsis magusensis]|uniref:type I-E CRISPR-associated protein Cas5/CasD n=1 Tax=Amycolatopsis magusensis TaxID=882444 RepID=UPI0024A7F52F|nr:type I-E CRISPR-associated protein Cas5/CasD [Amycolatopsis magusensis]MDI5982164.1 type I-E CRISPR-associated protein Cas5/CasD [Amycolatopsis magusensis]
MTESLVLCFDAPMQSWGQRSRAVLRDTALEPTKSGVIGLLAAAEGTRRDNTKRIRELAALRMGVRVDREGILERDYHTTQNVPNTLGKGHRTVVSERYYLADALFLVALNGPAALIDTLAEAVQKPHWPLYLGRRAFVPARPPFLTTSDDDLGTLLGGHDWLETSEHTRRVERANTDRVGLRTIIECSPTKAGAEHRNDQPLSLADGDRRYGPRTTLTSYVELTDQMIPGDIPCTSPN